MRSAPPEFSVRKKRTGVSWFRRYKAPFQSPITKEMALENSRNILLTPLHVFQLAVIRIVARDRWMTDSGGLEIIENLIDPVSIMRWNACLRRKEVKHGRF